MQNSYNVTPSPDGLTYYFTTRFNVTYQVLLSTYFIEDIKTFSLSLYPEEDALVFDFWVKNTVVKIIGDFLIKDSNTIFYICDSTDEKEAQRHKVFDYWYKRSKENYPLIRKHDYVIKSSYGYDIFSSLLYNDENPLANYIIDKFQRLMDES